MKAVLEPRAMDVRCDAERWKTRCVALSSIGLHFPAEDALGPTDARMHHPAIK